MDFSIHALRRRLANKDGALPILPFIFQSLFACAHGNIRFAEMIPKPEKIPEVVVPKIFFSQHDLNWCTQRSHGRMFGLAVWFCEEEVL